MHNVFITQLMDWRPQYKSRAVRLVNRVLEGVGSRTRVVPPHGTGSMSNTEQRMNLFHLLRQVLVYEVPGDVVDLGCHRGETGVLFGKVLAEYGPERRYHTYDAFPYPEALHAVHDNFALAGLKLPEIHQGWLEDMLPGELPERICFAHIDVGAKVAKDLKALVRLCLEGVYPRLSKGAVCVLQDYCDRSVSDTWDPWPAVKAAADEFLADKPEKVSVMYAGYYSHGFICKL